MVGNAEKFESKRTSMKCVRARLWLALISQSDFYICIRGKSETSSFQTFDIINIHFRRATGILALAIWALQLQRLNSGCLRRTPLKT